MAKHKRKKSVYPDSDIRIYPDGGIQRGKLCGAFETQAITDTTNRYAKTNVVKPSDSDIEEGRDWININQK